MVNISDFKEEKTVYLTVMDVMNATDRTAVVTAEATVQDFTSKKSGKTFRKLVIPVDFCGRPYLLGVYADIGQRIALSFGLETRDWIGRHLRVVVAGKGDPYVTVYPVD